MSTIEIVINSDKRKVEADNLLFETCKNNKWVRMVLYLGRDRTLEQNNLIYGMYARASKVRGDVTPTDVKQDCKLEIGVPVLLEENEKFRGGWNRFFRSLPYEQQLHIMGPNSFLGPSGLPVTSIMNRKQLNRYVDGIVSRYHDVNFEDMLSDE